MSCVTAHQALRTRCGIFQVHPIAAAWAKAAGMGPGPQQFLQKCLLPSCPPSRHFLARSQSSRAVSGFPLKSSDWPYVSSLKN